jgi:hypothetical protein
MHSSGESGIRPLEAATYFESCDPEVVTSIMCGYFGVDEPKELRRLNERAAGWRGWYKPREQVVAFSKPFLGLLIHEVSHHIYKMKGGKGHHNSGYWSILQQAHDFWR